MYLPVKLIGSVLVPGIVVIGLYPFNPTPELDCVRALHPGRIIPDLPVLSLGPNGQEIAWSECGIAGHAEVRVHHGKG